MINVEFVKKEKLSDDIYSFWFRPKEDLRFIAGQFIELFLEHDNPDSRGTKRWFTISSPPDIDLFSITTRISNNPSSFKRCLFNLTAGQPLKIVPPMGDFVLPKNPTKPVVFIAGGIGCTPFASIIADPKASERKIIFYHIVSKKADLIFSDTFAKIGKDYHPEMGRQFSVKTVVKSLKAPDEYLFYVSGPEKLVEDFVSELADSGIRRSRIHTDFFHGYN